MRFLNIIILVAFGLVVASCASSKVEDSIKLRDDRVKSDAEQAFHDLVQKAK